MVQWNGLKDKLRDQNLRLLNDARKANTDNKGKLLVTVFAFAPAPKTDF
jgi:hypothetical protein